MSSRNLIILSFLAVALGYGGDAYAERLGSNYRGPQDAKAADTTSTDESTDTSNEPDSTGPESGGGSDDSGGLSGEGGGGGGDGDGDGDGDGEGAPEAGGPTEGSLGGSDGSSSGESAGSTDDGSGGLTAGGGGAGGSRGAGGGGNAQERFQLVSWYFEHNRERFIYGVAEKRNARVRVPDYSAIRILGMLPADDRVRAPVTAEDRERIFDILKASTLDQADVVRDTAVIALGKLGGPKAVDVLKQRLEVEPKRDVKQDTLLGLGMTRSPDAVDPLIAALEDRSLASFALVGLGLTRDSEKAAPAVLEYFEDNERQAKKQVDQLCSAALALGNLRHEDALDALEKALKNKHMPRLVQVYCAQAVGRIGGERAQKVLLKALSGKDQQVSRAAALALGEFADADVLKALSGKDGLRSPDPLGAGYAAMSMGRILEALPESDWKKYPDAVRDMALGTRKNKIKAQYGNLALAVFDGFDNEVRRFYAEEMAGTALDPDTKSALAMAAGIGQMSSVAIALDELAGSVSSDPKLGSYAALSLGMLSGSNAGETAARLRKIYDRVDRDDVRRGTVLALGLVGDREDVPFLIGVIEKTEDKWLGGYTRGAAAVALGLIGDGESVALIQKLQSNADARTRAYAVAALGYLADKDTAPVLPKVFEGNNFREEFDTLKVLMGHL